MKKPEPPAYLLAALVAIVALHFLLPVGVVLCPMYVGFTLLRLGVALLFGTLAPLAVVVVFAVLMDVEFVRIEERRLGEKFGEPWESY
jgi:hypothetical protein